MKKKWYGAKRVACMCLAVTLCVPGLYGCDKAESQKDSLNSTEQTQAAGTTEKVEVNPEHTLGGTKNAKKEQEAFDKWCMEEFEDTMEDADTLSLHYTLDKPENYNIEEDEITFGEISVEQMQEDLEENAQCQAELATFAYDLLNEEQQVTYDVLDFYLKLGKESGAFYYYGNALSPDLGIPANTPVNLAEYPLRSKENVETYLTLLTKLPEYFKELAVYEQEVAKKGLFISDAVLEKTLKQMNEFIKTPENNYLITTFAERLDGIEDITEEEKQTFVKTNQEYVNKYVISAYKQLITDISALKGSGKNQGGLCHFEDGKAYYEYLVKYYTCSDMTVDEAWNILTQRIKTLMKRMTSIMQSNTAVYNELNRLTYPSTNPDEILNYLKTAMEEYYPECPAVNYKVKHVDESLAESLSPAFFMVPQIDNYLDNVIYINDKSSNYDSSSLFPTLAHEGFPGHLYQTTYYNATNPEPIRQILNFGGYAEGWATYVELSSYELVDFGENDKDVTDICQIESEFSLALSSIADIGINYKGWDKMELKKYLDDFGMGENSLVNELSELVISNPANYLQYYVSYLEFWNLRCKAKQALGSDFDSKEFHRVVLDCGPAPFGVIEQQVDEYIEEVQEQAS